jgi:acyl-coenzyme A thioesterase PaaI-like protein
MQLLGLLPEGATIIGKGRVVRGGRRVVFLEGELLTEEGQLLARATSTAIPTARPAPPPQGE